MKVAHTFYSAKVERAEKLDSEWRRAAACVDHDTATFFPAGTGATPPDFGPALRVCRSCPALRQCRQWAETAGEIVNGHALHGQVVGGCAPAPKRKYEVTYKAKRRAS